MRCVLEARSHDENSFITLTYDDDQLPKDRSLDKTHLQKFFKRLRKQKGPFRHYGCGEYGDQTQRAHYHACLFGIDFHDKVELRKIGEHTLYYSEELTKIWGYGHTSVGALTFESAAYCARYVLKKKTGLAKGNYRHCLLDEETGELIELVQPFSTVSNGGGRNATFKGGLGKVWLLQHNTDIYNNDKDFLVLRGKKLRPPKYFDQVFDTINPAKLERIKKKRKEEREELTLTELRAHEKITRARIIQRKQV